MPLDWNGPVLQFADGWVSHFIQAWEGKNTDASIASQNFRHDTHLTKLLPLKNSTLPVEVFLPV